MGPRDNSRDSVRSRKQNYVDCLTYNIRIYLRFSIPRTLGIERRLKVIILRKGLSRNETIILALILFLVAVAFVYLWIEINAVKDDPFPESAEKIKESIILVHLDNGTHTSYGTGFIVDEEGYFLTAKHVFESVIPSGMDYYEYVTNRGKIKYGKEGYFEIKPIKNDDLERKDVQLAKIKTNNPYLRFTSLEIANEKEISGVGVEIGFWGYTIAYTDVPDAEPFLFLSKGILSSVDKNITIEDKTNVFYTLNAISTGGYSGGPVFLAENGKVIALIKGTTSDPKGKTGIVYVPYVHEVPMIISRLKDIS